MKRRTFIKSLGLGVAGSLFLPFHQSVFSANENCKRLVIFIEGNGVEGRNFLTSATEAALAAVGTDISATRHLYWDYKHDAPEIVGASGLSGAPSLGSLATNNGFALEDHAAVVLGLSSKITGGGHTTGTGALGCTRSLIGSPAGVTIDEYLSLDAGLRGETPFQVVRLGVSPGQTRLNYHTCAFGRNRPAPIMTDPTTAFNSLFGSVASAAGRRTFLERAELLDFATVDVKKSLSAFAGNSRERAKLERYLESLETMVNRQTKIVGLQAELEAAKPGEPGDVPLYTSTAPLERLQAQVDMATASLLGGLTNVVVIALGTGSGFSLTYESLAALYPGGDLLGGHDVRHAAEKGVQGYMDLLTTITERHVGMMSQMARSLHDTPEAGGDGTMLENTAMVYMSDNGEKHHSRAEEWPMLLMGGQRLGLQTDGRTVVYPRYGHDNNRQVSNLFNTLGYATGQPLDDFGSEGQTRITEGPLSELYVPV